MIDTDRIDDQRGNLPNHNGQRSLMRSLSILGGLAIVGTVAIFCSELHVEHATIYAGLLLTLLTSIFGADGRECAEGISSGAHPNQQCFGQAGHGERDHRSRRGTTDGA